MTRPAIDPARIARESLISAINCGWDDGLCREYAVLCLRGHGLPRAEARAVVQRVWDERFRVWRAC